MINVQDFKIGNYIQFRQQLRRITMLNSDPGFADAPFIGFLTEAGPEYCSCGDAELLPVPLTDHLLTKLGYSFNAYYRLWQHPKVPNTFTLELDADYRGVDFAHRPVVPQIRSLHTLQNLYYVLSGEELVLAGEKQAALIA